MSRLFYDPSAPVMLSEDQVLQMNSSDIQAATQQIDQILVSKLQAIDHHFAQSTQILTDHILAKVQQHGENSQAIYESIKFWRPFFEAAARTRLNDPYATEQSMTTDAPADAAASPARGANESLEFEQPSVGQVSRAELDATPRTTQTAGVSASPVAGPNASLDWPSAPDISPLKSLETDWHKMAASPEAYPDVDVERVRRGISQLHAASPNVTMPSLDLGSNPLANDGPSPAPSSSSYLPPRSPGGARLKAGADKLHPGLLQRVLAKQAAGSSSRPGASTPARGKTAFPEDLPKNWNGVADLSQTPLSAFGASPIKRATGPDDSVWEGDYAVAGEGSPALVKPMTQLNLSPVKYKATPAKEAAARASKFTYDAFEDEDDNDLAPPSVIREATRKFDLSVADSSLAIAPSPSEGARKGFEEEAFEDDDEEEEEEEEEEERGGRPTPLDFGGGTTAKIDDLLDGSAPDEFAQLVDDDDLAPSNLIDDEEETGGLADDSYVVEDGISQDIAPTGPEDTLFGMPQRRQARFADESIDADEDEGDDSFAAGQGIQKQFRVLGGDDMHTLHGGDLLDSEPFEGSPLAGRDRA